MRYSRGTIAIRHDNRHKVLFISGLHGNETNAVRTMMHYFKYLKNIEDLNTVFDGKVSSITFLTGLNEYGLKHCTRETGSESSKDLNRLFIEPETNYKDILEEYIEQADIVIDVHNSPIQCCSDFEILLTCDRWAKSFYKVLKTGEQDGIHTAIWDRDTPTVKRYVNSDPFKKGITLEIGGMSFASQNQIEHNMTKLSKLVTLLCGVHKEPSEIDYKLCMQNVVFHTDGMLEWDIATLGQRFSKGDRMATIYDFGWNEKEIIYAPCDCRLVGLDADSDFVNRGNSFMVQPEVEV